MGAVVADDDVNASTIPASRLVDSTNVPGKQPLLVVRRRDHIDRRRFCGARRCRAALRQQDGEPEVDEEAGRPGEIDRENERDEALVVDIRAEHHDEEQDQCHHAQQNEQHHAVLAEPAAANGNRGWARHVQAGEDESEEHDHADQIREQVTEQPERCDGSTGHEADDHQARVHAHRGCQIPGGVSSDEQPSAKSPPHRDRQADEQRYVKEAGAERRIADGCADGTWVMHDNRCKSAHQLPIEPVHGIEQNRRIDNRQRGEAGQHPAEAHKRGHACGRGDEDAANAIAVIVARGSQQRHNDDSQHERDVQRVEQQTPEGELVPVHVHRDCPRHLWRSGRNRHLERPAAMYAIAP